MLQDFDLIKKTQSIDFEIDCALFCELEFDFL